MAKKKQTAQAVHPKNGKQTATQESPDSILKKPLGWNFRLMDKRGPWHCTFKDLNKHRKKLLTYEGRACSDIFNRSNHCHPMPFDVLSERAQNRLKKIGFKEDTTLHQLVIDPWPARLWGVLKHNVFCLLWIDHNHSVYPMGK